MSRIGTLLASTFITILAIPAVAQAETAVETEKNDDGYGYIFRDDPMTGNTGAAESACIKVRPQGIRRTLIRPRTHFVPEMLKSVEML